MKKRWLIRTKNNHILGPVSKEKIKELLKNASIKGDDEVCCANGFWMYVREKELLDQYVFGEETQNFNPVQEANSCQISDFPPDLNQLKVRPEQTGSNHQLGNTSIQKNPLMPPSQNETADEVGQDTLNPNADEQEKKKSNVRIIKTRNSRNVKTNFRPVKRSFDKRTLYLFILLFLIILLASLWKKEIIIDHLKQLSYLRIIPEVQAQTLSNQKKKAGFLLT